MYSAQEISKHIKYTVYSLIAAAALTGCATMNEPVPWQQEQIIPYYQSRQAEKEAVEKSPLETATQSAVPAVIDLLLH